MSQPVRADLSMTMQEALAWAKARVSVLPDEFYDSLPAQLRSRAFTVSGMAKLDQIQGVLDLMNKALAKGQTMAQWQAGLSKEALSLGANRLDNIFRTGIQTHFNIGRTIRQRENIANRPYYMWDAINDSRTRPAHRKMDGFIAPMSDPIWQKWSAPAGFRCRCVRITLTEEQAIKRGYRPGQSWPDAQPDEGWAYEKADGQDAALWRLIDAKRSQCNIFGFAKNRTVKPIWCDDRGMDYLKSLDAALDSNTPMPMPRVLEIPLLPVGQDEAFYISRFMAEFDAKPGETAIIKAATGLHDLAVSALMFEDHKTGRSKINKNGRAPWLRYLAKTILDPDEIRLAEGGHGDRALYHLSRYQTRNGLVHLFAVFKEDGKVWTGWTGYQQFRQEYTDLKRNESIAIYRRQ